MSVRTDDEGWFYAELTGDYFKCVKGHRLKIGVNDAPRDNEGGSLSLCEWVNGAWCMMVCLEYAEEPSTHFDAALAEILDLVEVLFER